MGILLFLFIPLVLFLFLRYPFGILPSFAAAILIMFSHRFLAVPFMKRNLGRRCLWCGKASRARVRMPVQARTRIDFEFCKDTCMPPAKRFFDFCKRYRNHLRIGIFIPLLWYVLTMLLKGAGRFNFPDDWNRFLFQFFIACSVVSVSFLYRKGFERDDASFPFPIHNLFLLGIRNTLLVFRYVGIWWILESIYFLYTKLFS